MKKSYGFLKDCYEYQGKKLNDDQIMVAAGYMILESKPIDLMDMALFEDNDIANMLGYLMVKGYDDIKQGLVELMIKNATHKFHHRIVEDFQEIKENNKKAMNDGDFKTLYYLTNGDTIYI